MGSPVTRLSCLVLSSVIAFVLGGCWLDDGSSDNTEDLVTITAEPVATAVHVGSRTEVQVHLERTVPGSDDILVVVADLPAGLSTSSLLLKPHATGGSLLIQADPTIDPNGTVKTRVEAYAGEELIASAPIEIRILPAAARPIELIEEALAEGRIDLGTSLLYRAYARYGDSRLPEEFWGSGESTEDLGLFREIDRARHRLPAHILGELERFAVRPTDSRSIFNEPAAPRVSAADAAVRQTRPPCEYVWSPRDSEKPFRVWVQHCREEDISVVDGDLEHVVKTIERIWDEEIRLMGPPVPDVDALGDGRIDFYVLSRLANPRITTRDISIDQGPTAAAVSERSSYARPNTESGYVLVNRSRIFLDSFLGGLANEMIHVLQFAHNSNDLYCGSIDRPPNCKTVFWFYEASAVWAQSYFTRKVGRGVEQSSLRRYVSNWFPYTFQQIKHPLHVTEPKVKRNDYGWRLPYSAYVWALFAEQETGSGEIIGRIWESLEKASDFKQGLEAINNTFSLQSSFTRFSLRNINRTFDDQDPIAPRFVARDEYFKDQFAPTHLNNHKSLNIDESRAVVDKVRSLEASYHHFTVPGDYGSLVIGLEIDLRSISGSGTLVAGALIKDNKNQWSIRESISVDSPITLCDAREIYLVLGNTALESMEFLAGDGGQVLQGNFSIKASLDPCACDRMKDVQEWRGTLDFSWEFAGTDEFFDTNYSHQVAVRDIKFQHLVVPGYIEMRSDLVGQAKLLARHVSKDSQPPSVFTVEGNGTTNVAVGPGFPSVSWMSLTVDLTTCEYTIHTETGVNATHTDRNGSSVMGVAGISIINSERRRVGSGPSFDMSGGGSFTVRSPTWRASTTVDRYMPFGITIYEINRPDELGKASVRWSISPAPQASSPAGN